jgi:hypothetical protein
MASVSGLLQVRVRQAKGLDAAPAAALTVRLRLLPWKEEQSSDTAQCDDDGTAEWALSDANLVVLPHLAAHDEAQPQLSIDLRSRELLVYERCLGLTTIDAQPLLIPGEENEMWISLNEKTSVLLQTKFVPGTTTPTAIARTPSLVLNEDVRHQHLFRLQSYNTPQWCAVCDKLMMGLRHQGFRCEACGLSVHGGCQLKAHAVFDCVGKKPPQIETPQPSFDEPLVQGSPRAKRSPSGDAIFVDDVEEGVGRLELHLASVKLLETSDEEDTTTGDYYVRSRRPSHDAGGGSFFDIELFPDRVGAVAACQRDRGRGDGVFTRQRRRDAVDAMPHRTESSDRAGARRVGWFEGHASSQKG